MIAAIFIIIGFFIYLICYIKSRDILHPLGIGALLWFLTVSISSITSLYDPSLQVPISLETNIALFLAGISFSLPVLLSKEIKKDRFRMQEFHFGIYYRLIYNFFVLLSICAFLIRFHGELLSPPLIFSTGFDLKQSVPIAVPYINFADLATPFLAILSIWELKESKSCSIRRRVILLGYVLFCIVSLLVYKVSRGEFVIFMLGVLYIIVIPRSIIVRFRYLVIVAAFAALFFYIGSLRISEESRVSTQFGSGGINILFSQLYTYIAMNFQNLNNLINSNFEPTYIWGGLKFLLKPFFSSAYETNEIGLTDYTVLFFNAKTYIYYFYNDLGLAGVIFYSLIIGCGLQLVYNISVNNTKYFVLIACFMKPIIFMFFGNYFFGEFVILIPYFMVLILILNVKSLSVGRNDFLTK